MKVRDPLHGGRVTARRCSVRSLASRGGIFVSCLLACTAGGTGDAPGDDVVVPDAPLPAEPTPTAPAAPPMAGGEFSPMGPELFDNGSEAPMSSVTPGAAPGARRGLLERQVTCPDGGTTRVSGTVYIPSGQLPVYNATVYVPDGQLQPLTPGPSCTCELTGEPIAATLTDAAGHFVLENVPVGEQVPLVVQVGEWRREFELPNVERCAETQIPDQTLRLPARRSEGDIPKIAVATGFLDALECLVRKLGVDESEFTTERDGGRINLFAGLGGTKAYAAPLNGGLEFAPAEALWYDERSLSEYDIVLMSCDGYEDNVTNKSEQSLAAMKAYLDAGGRVFGSHYQDVWFRRGPAPFPELAQYDSRQDLEDVVGQVVTSFPKGQALAEWLVNAGVSDVAGQVAITGAQHNIVQENPMYAQRWIATTAPEDSVQYISANTPLGVSDAEQCGRLVLSDIHVSPGDPGDDISDPEHPFPTGCVTSELTPQEAVLAFMLFDISACVVPDDQAPVPPPIIR